MMEPMSRGRPPQDGEKRTQRLEVRALDTQIAAWRAAAELGGEDLSAWARRVLDEAAERETRRG
jgi:hypothetical protein